MADNLTLALKIKADLNNALRNFKSLEAEMQRTSVAGKGLADGAQAGAKGFNSLAKNADVVTNKLGKTRAGVESISVQLAKMKSELLGLTGLSVGAIGLTQIAQTADEYNNYQSRIQLVSKSNREASRTFRQLMTVANDTGQLFGATAELYTRVYRAMGDRANSQELLQFTKTINQSMVVSGANAQEASAALIQLSQGMASGTLRGEEFNSVAEQAPVILEMLQKSLGKTRGELRKMAEDGELTTEVVLRAVRESAEGVQAQYDQMPKTIGRAVNELTNAWMQFIGQTDGALSASSVAATIISTLAQNLNVLGNAALVVAGIMVGRFMAGLIQTSAGLVKQTYLMATANQTLIARAAIEVKAAQSALAMARATDAETAAVARLAAANKALALAQGGLLGLRGGLMALAGGPIGLAMIALMGLVTAYQYLSEKEAEAERQFQETTDAITDNIDKTRQLIEARREGAQIQTFSQVSSQENANIAAIGAAKAQLEALRREYQQLQDSMAATGYADLGALEETRQKMTALEQQIDTLSAANRELGEITRNQLTTAFDAVVAAGGEFAERLQLLAAINPQEAIRKLTDAIKESENELIALDGELDAIEKKLRQELADATMTAGQQLESMRGRMEALAKSAGWTADQLNPLIAQLDLIISLQRQVENAKQAKSNESFFANLSKQARQSGMSRKDKMIDDIKNQPGASPEQIAQGIKDANTIAANENKGRGGSRRRGGGGGRQKSATDQAAENEQKNLELHIQYLRLTGQEVKANLTDVESRYNRMIGEIQKAGNVDGINLIKKILPLEQAKVQVDGLQTEINKLFQNQSAQEQSIQAQVQTGLITHLAGQQKLKEVYAQTVTEIEKQLPLLQQLAKMPGAQGEQARQMLEQMKLKIVELKTAGNELQKAFEDGLTRGIESSLMSLAQGTMTLKDAIKNLALTVVNAMAQVAAQQLALQAVSGITGLFGGAAGASVMAATGGYIRGPGTGTSDSIPARLSNGEFVVREAMVRKYGVGFLHAINRGRLAGFADGGLVSSPAMPQYREPRLTQAMQEGTAGQIQVAAPPVNIKQTLAVDSAELFTAGIGTVAGERAVMTTLIANKDTIKQALNN